MDGHGTGSVIGAKSLENTPVTKQPSSPDIRWHTACTINRRPLSALVEWRVIPNRGGSPPPENGGETPPPRAIYSGYGVAPDGRGSRSARSPIRPAHFPYQVFGKGRFRPWERSSTRLPQAQRPARRPNPDTPASRRHRPPATTPPGRWRSCSPSGGIRGSTSVVRDEESAVPISNTSMALGSWEI
jgi:hypothetical protein